LNPSFIPTLSSSPTQVTLVDVVASGKPVMLSVRWPRQADSARTVEATTIEQLRMQLQTLHEVEQQRRDAEVPAARRTLGKTLWDMLDGPECRLARAMAAAEDQGDPLELVIRLRVEGDLAGLVDHPASAWRWELLSPAAGGHPSAEGRMHLVVQMGDVVPRSTPRVLEHGGLRIVFMACSPQGVQPLLDYEAEEERILRALERPIEERRARVQVVEDGTLAELERRLMHAPADVVHLTGHGVAKPEGPRLFMEDDLGRCDEIAPEDLLRVLKRAAKKPDLVVISSCHSAAGRDGFPSFAAALVAGGMPAVIGWVQPVRDDVATAAAAALYGRLCRGDTPAQAVAFVREQLVEADREDPHPSHAWGTLHLLMRDARGFRVGTLGIEPLPKTTLQGDAHYRYLEVTGGMRVLKEGFIGRRRQLQRLLRVLRTSCDDHGKPLAGAIVLGMKGVGKSCLVGRVTERYAQDYESTSTVVLHGVLDDVTVVRQFSEVARKRCDEVAEAILQRDEPVSWRVQRLLTTRWADDRIVVILDDFEKNLELREDGDAWPLATATAFLEVLVPACQGNRPKLLVTTTASFRALSGQEYALAEVALSSFEPPMLHKLWNRMPEEDREKVSLAAWRELGDRLGRNARVLDWARTLLRGKSPEEVEEVARKAGEAITRWNDGEGPSAERTAELARIYLRTLAMDETRKRLSEDALTFIKRARVYEWPVPKEAFEGLLDGLAIELDRDVTVLQNLGMLEVGEMDGRRAHRVSPLVEPDFDVEDVERWHAVAAAFWERASDRGSVTAPLWYTSMAWVHALQGKCEDVAERCGRRLSMTFYARGMVHANQEFASRHLEVFPNSGEGLLWAGKAAEQWGDLHKGWELYKRGETIAYARNSAMDATWCRIRAEGAIILWKLGRLEEAEQRLKSVVRVSKDLQDQEAYASVLGLLASVQLGRGCLQDALDNHLRALAIKMSIYRSEEHPAVAASLHELAGVLLAQGDIAGARARLLRSIDVWIKFHGTEENPDVATSLHELARVLAAQGDDEGARAHLERSCAIATTVYGTTEHPSIATSLHELALLLVRQGDLVGARSHLERALAIKIKAYGTEVHPYVASSLGELARVLQKQGDLSGARARFERSLAIEMQARGTEEHPNVAAHLWALADVLGAQGDLEGARAHFERSLAILMKVHGTEEHPDVADCLHALACVLEEQGDIIGARARLERSLAIKVKVYGTEEHPDVATTMRVLSGVLKVQGEDEEARAYCDRSLAIRVKVHGTEEHPDVAASMYALASILKQQGMVESARALLERSLAILEQIHGTEGHVTIAATLVALADTLREQGDLGHARGCLERAVAIDIKMHGTHVHSDVASSLRALVGVLEAQGHRDRAVVTYHRVLHIEACIFGTLDQECSAETEASLGLLLLEMDRGEEAFGFLCHAYSVLATQAPTHPAMAVLRQIFGDRPAIHLGYLSRLVLKARHSGGTPPNALVRGLFFMARAGPPLDTVAALFEIIATGQPLPPNPELPEPVATFVRRLLVAAHTIVSARRAADSGAS
jgi:tetratricopeptide (TPR) repeat protein